VTSAIVDSNRVPIGLDRNREWVDLRFTEIENPHILIVGGSQVGKTTLQILTAAVTASRGNIVIILDPKQRFDRPFRRPITHESLPHVLVYGDPDPDVAAQEWDGITTFLVAEMQRRYHLDKSSDVSILEDEQRFPTILVVIDELGTALDFVDKEWNKRKPDGYKGDTPFRENLHTLTRMGAEARLIGCFANQTAAEREMPAGTRTRQLCGQRIFLGPIREGPQWRMLAGEGVERPDIPAGQRGAGAVIFSDGKPWRFQAGFIDWKNRSEDVYNLAAQGVPLLRARGHIDDQGNLLLGGRPVPRPGRMASLVTSGRDDLLRPAPAAEDTDEDGRVSCAPPARVVVGLEAGAEFCGMSVANFRKWRQLDPIPNEVAKYQGNKPAWEEFDLREWALRRSENRRGTANRNEKSA
jgi:hypothetical protein